MASKTGNVASFLVIASFALAGCGKDNGIAAPSGTPAANSADSAASDGPETAVTALQRTLTDIGSRLAATRTRASSSAVRATTLSTTCERGAVAARDLGTSLQEVTNYANRLASLNQRRATEIEGDALAAEGRSLSAVDQTRMRLANHEREVRAAENTLADADRNLIATPATELAAARARRDAAVAVLNEAVRNRDTERRNLTEAEGVANNITGRREEAARRLLVDAATIDAELQATEDRVAAAEASTETCGS